MEDNRMPGIIIIDDDSMNNLLSSTVIRLDFPTAIIKSFTDPRKGMDFIREQYETPATNKVLLLLDINMPYLSGWDCLDMYFVNKGKNTTTA